MNTKTMESTSALDLINEAFITNYPKEASRKIESMVPKTAALAIQDLPIYSLSTLCSYLTPTAVSNILPHLSQELITKVLTTLDTTFSAAIISKVEPDFQTEILGFLDKSIASELQELMQYPPDTAGALMSTKMIVCHKDISVEQAILQFRQQKFQAIYHLFLLDDNLKIHSKVEIQRLVLADKHQSLASIATPISIYADAFEPKDEIIHKLEKFRADAIPIIDTNQHLLGVIRSKDFLEEIKEDIISDMQTMVGVSKDEKALSNAAFAVKKRLPWLEINLLTAFLAAAVVGMFESTIAKYTALAVLLPVAAGQSGNSGAQALAVTMRGLALREITTSHWLKLVIKEFCAGFINGIAIAITCALGVFVWSKSFGLALVMALAMVISMVIACVSGALVPIVLKKVGLDPAQSSSIILTTVTDIAGFMSFLGIATLLSSLL